MEHGRRCTGRGARPTRAVGGLWVILFSSMDVAVSFIPRGSTLRTRFSRDHSTRSGLLLPILVLAKSSRNLTRALLGSHHRREGRFLCRSCPLLSSCLPFSPLSLFDRGEKK